MTNNYLSYRAYFLPLLLPASILFGGLTGAFYGDLTPWLKPFGDIFLNTLLTVIVPLVFFCIASAVARSASAARLGNILSYMLLVFFCTEVIAAICALCAAAFLPPTQSAGLAFTATAANASAFSDQIVALFTVPDFSALFSHQHMLALIIFSILVGIASAKTQAFRTFLQAGEDVFMRVFDLIMYFAPIGFFAYFSVLVNQLGSQFMQRYLAVSLLYYACGIAYFLLMFTLYAYLADKVSGVKRFWGNVLLPAVTAVATCSSAASIPANLEAAKKMRIAPEISETVIPLGSLIHKDGSVIGSIFKIAFLFGMFQLDLFTFPALLTAIGVSLVVGTVMGAIPGGGMLGELFILTAYGFPPSTLMAIAAISIIIDPLATLLNVTGNTVSTMLIERLADT